MKHLLLVGLLLLLSLPLIIPFLYTGYFPTHDGEWAIVRLAEMHREIKDLQIPPRWSTYLNHGYGYPLFLFTYPFPYFLGEVFHSAGLGLTNTIKLLFIFSIIGSATTMFLLGKALWGRQGGLIATAFYLYAPYRLTNLYVRGSLGESLSFVFFPLLFWLTYRLSQRHSFSLFLATTLSFAAFILTHNAMVVLFMPWVLVWLLILTYHNRKLLNKMKFVYVSLFLGILLVTFFWLPAVYEKRYIALNQIPLAQKEENFVTLAKLLIPQSSLTATSLSIGVLHFLMAALGGIIILFKKHQTTILYRALPLFACISILSLFSQSTLLWQIPLLKEIDFPWRNLAVASFFLSLIGGVLVQRKFSKITVIVSIVFVMLLNSEYIQTRGRIYKSDLYYETNDATTTSADELMPIWTSQKPRNRPTSLIASDHERVSTPYEQSQHIEFEITSQKETTLVLNKLYFPGWHAYIDGQQSKTLPTQETGLLSFSLPRGTHIIHVNFENTPIRLLANILSMVSVGFLISLWIVSKKYFLS